MHWKSRILHATPSVPPGFRSFATPVYRGSTILFDKMADAHDEWHFDRGYNYGLYGTPTALELAGRIAELEGARRTFLAPGGQAAISLIYLSFCRAGSHALVPSNAYGPNRQLANGLLRNLGIEVEPYDPLTGSDIAALIRTNTALIWCESPGSVTMEIQDLPAIVAAAHAQGVPVALDNTYAAGVLLDAFGIGVDISIQALTKYISGHSDLLLGQHGSRLQSHRRHSSADRHGRLTRRLQPCPARSSDARRAPRKTGSLNVGNRAMARY